MVLVFHHVIIFFLLSDWLIQILPPFWFCCDVACFCFGSETQLKCTYRRCCQFFKNIVLCLDVLSGRESASMATFFFMTLLLFSRMLASTYIRTTYYILLKLTTGLSSDQTFLGNQRQLNFPNCYGFREVFLIFEICYSRQFIKFFMIL